jgi:RHS repeat-associated protein
MLSEKDILPGNGATYNTYTTYYTYNPDDTMATMTYPDQEKLTYHYDSRMLLTKVTSDNATPTSTGDDVEYVSSTTYDPSGRIDDRVLGNGLTQDYTYYGWAEKVNEIGQGGRLKTLTTGGLQNLGYTYDKVGNITDINNATADEKQTYAYDALDRLTNWTASNTGVTPNEVTYQETYSYNTFTGNLESKANVKSNTSLDLLYTDATHKHAVTGAGANSYGYDPNGNMTARLVNGKNYQLAYDAENRLTEVRTDSAVPPTITSFGATTPVTNSLSIPIGPFTATDSGSVTGYMITTSTTAPLAGDTRWSPTAPGNFPVTEDGTYTLYPWAKDNEDNVSPINATLGRTVIVDRGIPTVTLNSAPPAVDGNKRASFTFTINDGPKGVIDLIKCKVDAYAYDDCTSPYTTPETPGLSNGPHTFSVYAVDTAGNTSPVVTHTWNVLHYQGTGADGSLTVASGATYNINTQNNGTRTCANGGDAVSYTVTGLTSTTATLSTTVAAGCLNAGDEVLLINVRGITSSYANAGNYESLLVSSVNGSVVTFTFAKQKLYGNNGGDTNLGTGATQQHVILQRVPNYNDVTVTGTLTASAWNGSKYGILAFRVKGILSGAGTIKADALGYVSAETYVGAGIAGYGAGTTYICCGGGGGYGTDGMGSGHGVAYGAANLDKLYFGSGGGASAAVRSEGRLLDPSYPGGSGGGILLIEGKDINFTGTLNANGVGNSISAATGSGAGGSIRIKGYDVNLNAKSVTGGTVGNAGGVGRIAVYYFNTTNVTANTTTFLQKLNLTAMNLQTPSLASLPVYEDVEVVWRHPHTVRIVSDSPAYKPLSTVSVLATFTYDGDGKRVKAVENGVTTLFIGNHYEVNQTTGQVTKYYFAGATRVAIGKYSIPQRMKVEYVLGDHLGSTSITTNMDGVKISEMRYKPWGEVRSAWYDPDLNDETKPNKITTPTYQLTRYTYTGQYSYMDDPSTTGVDGFGLMYYGARFYDPYLGRMAQADTIVPGGVQGLDRYAYVNNNPVNLIDPSGHCASEDDEDNCYEKLDQNHTDIVATISMIQKKFGNVTIKYSSKWNLADLQEIYSGLNTIMGKNGFNGDVEAFVAAMGEVTYVPVAVGSLGYDPNTNLPIPARADYKTGIIQVATNASTDNIIHEMGHIFSGTLTRENARVPSYRQMFPNVFDAGSGATLYGQASTVEDFADSFLAVIKYGPQAINKVDQPRIDTINALIQSYTNLDHTLSPGR